MTDFDAARFVDAQAPVLAEVEAELAAGRKRTHWMWFVFPQLAGLGLSPTAQRFALAGLGEAKAYLADPVLGERLRRHVRLMLRHRATPVRTVLGSPDDLKFRSCLTLFRAAATDPADAELFAEGLQAFYRGELDARTLELLGQS
ncbi:DUF1810 domain-containing protein [Ancylobacter sp. MQZ15Z-1]|uniref:DUF1810 domain-containing protein n=1 Tax=Ancylobacter mangrovi TaxID=2972472 RepID=A0A9X2T3S8_9HYPH|nr:DUF1810 domain-containing protein [Ancylobacter mangrovi]MCS0495291.1 DUF1810 domain-containing protein [Ancylobacter mangrovi]